MKMTCYTEQIEMKHVPRRLYNSSRLPHLNAILSKFNEITFDVHNSCRRSNNYRLALRNQNQQPDNVAVHTSHRATKEIGEHFNEFPIELFGEPCWGKNTFAASKYALQFSNKQKADLETALSISKVFDIVVTLVF
jgi:hypothetical protein